MKCAHLIRDSLKCIQNIYKRRFYSGFQYEETIHSMPYPNKL